MTAVEIKKLYRYFGKNMILKNLNLKVRYGEIFGILGHNGAGKTTLISILSTLLLPSEGTVKMNGFDLVKEPQKIRETIGVVFQNNVLDDELTVFDNLNFYSKLYKIKDKNRIIDVIKFLGLKGKENIRYEELSFGMKRKLEIGKSFLHFPKILLLDEPTLGIDPKTRRKIWDHILYLNRNNRITVFLATNYIEEAKFLCHRIGVLKNGSLIRIEKNDDFKLNFEHSHDYF